MARVQMLLSVTGGRGDGSEWPPAGGILVCGDDEARDLVLGRNARWVPDEERAVLPPAAAQEPAGDAEPTAEPAPDAGDSADGAPSVREPKAAWEAHAVGLGGVTPEVAAAMTKADLVSKFGTTSG